jgi:hypothetical protein
LESGRHQKCSLIAAATVIWPIIYELIIAIAIAAITLLFIIALAGDRFPEGGRQLEAVKVMRGIHAAEGEYKLIHGHYASLDRLGPRGSGLLAEGVAFDRGSGCDFRLNLNGGYEVTAVRREGDHQLWSLYMDATGIVRYSPGSSTPSVTSQAY